MLLYCTESSLCYITHYMIQYVKYCALLALLYNIVSCIVKDWIADDITWNHHMKSYYMKSWYHMIHIQISHMISHPDILEYDIISLKSYAWDMISRNQNIWLQVTYDIIMIVSSMKSYPWYHSQAYHICMHYDAYITHEITLHKIMISYPYFIYEIMIDFMVYEIISLKSYAWDMISRNHHIWFQVTYDIIVSSMKSYQWNQNQAYDIMQSCLWNHSDAYDIIDLWYQKTMIS